MEYTRLKELMEDRNDEFILLLRKLMRGEHIHIEMYKEYRLLEEYEDVWRDYFKLHHYILVNEKTFYYLEPGDKNVYADFSYFKRSDTFTGLYFAIRYAEGGFENRILSLNQEKNKLFEFISEENLYSIFVKKTKKNKLSVQMKKTLMYEIDKAVNSLEKYHFLQIVPSDTANAQDRSIKLLYPLKRFYKVIEQLFEQSLESDTSLEKLIETFIEKTTIDMEESEEYEDSSI